MKTRRAWPTHCAWLAALALTTSPACLPRARTHQIYSLPLTAARAAQINTGDALVSYLRQRDADPDVCDSQATGTHFTLPTQRDVEDVIDGVGQGVNLQAWERCVALMLARLPEPASHATVDRLLARYVERVVYPRLEEDARVAEELEVIRRTYEERPEVHDPTPVAVDRALELLRSEQERLSARGREYQTRLLSVLALERGLMPDGSAVDIGALDRLAAAGQEEELLVFARRVPDPGLREQAARRLIRLRIRSSPFRELASDATVEDRVLATGRNPVPLQARPEARFVAAHLPFRGLIVTQDVPSQTASLLSFRDSESNTSVVPPIDLHGAIELTVPGWSHPLTVCAGPDSFDPDPCVDAQQLQLGVPFATLETDGHFRFRETIRADEVVAIARAGGATFRMPVLFQNQPLVELTWTLRIRTAAPLAIAPGHGQPGPEVSVEIDGTSPAHLYYTVQSGSRRYLAVVEPAHVREFGVSAQGGSGEPGRDGEAGYEGAAGQDGNDADCDEGRRGTSGGPAGDGGPGGDGGDGGDGGPGGLLRARFVCADASCNLEREVRAGLSAPGGAAGRAGEAGPGGAGGAGGAGGSSASCDGYDLEGGENGPDGTPGPDGRPGYAGRPGRDGRVELRVERRAAAVVPAGGSGRRRR